LISLVIVDDFNVLRPGSRPSEDDSPLLVDADAVAASTIAFELLEPIAWWDSEISDDISSIENQELS
jgi:hypothetical protein